MATLIQNIPARSSSRMRFVIWGVAFGTLVAVLILGTRAIMDNPSASVFEGHGFVSQLERLSR